MDLFDRKAVDLLRFFARRTLQAEVAADLAAETFAQAFASRQSYDCTKGSLDEWLAGIARHELSHYWRRLSVETRARSELRLPQIALDEAQYERVEELIDLNSEISAAHSAMLALPNEQREAISLRIVEGLSYREVAARLGCKPATARARASRGLRAVAQALADSSGDLSLQEPAAVPNPSQKGT